MSLLSFLQGIGGVGVRHLFTLNNEGLVVGDDLGNSANPTNITGGTYSFVNSPVCLGFTHSARSTTSTSESVDGTLFANRNDINANGGGTYDWATGSKHIFFWARELFLYNVTCMYEQGGSVNNLAFMGGARSTWQAADSGQPFLIVPAKTLTQVNRSYLHYGGWEYRTFYGGADNRIWYSKNGVIQGYFSDGGTASFPAHTGDIVIGNSSDSLRTFNGNTLTSETVAKESNLLGMVNNPAPVNLNEGDIHPDSRELFERTVIAENVIIGTLAQQQAALDALDGTVFQDVNCAIEIRQATDQAGDYTLTLNNIQFVQNPNLRDIAIMWTSPNTLTLINSGTSNAEEVSTPPERELIFNDAGSNIVGGGTVVLQKEVSIAVQINDLETGLPLENAHVQLVNSIGKTNVGQIITDALGQGSLQVIHESDFNIEGWVRQVDLVGEDYKPENVRSTVTENGTSFLVNLEKIE